MSPCSAFDTPALLFAATMSVRVLVASCPDLTDARIFALTHPRTGAAVQFVRTADALLEVHRFRDSAIPRSRVRVIKVPPPWQRLS